MRSETKITAFDGAAGGEFGKSLDIDGDTLVVSSSLDNPGSIYVYVFNNGWQFQQKLTPPDPGQVEIDGDTIIVGASYSDEAGPDSGSAYVYTRSNGVWTQQQKLTGSGAAAGDRFGVSVSLQGDLAAVGAHVHGGGGAAYVFSRSNGVWTEDQKISPDDPEAGSQFGLSVALDENRMAIGKQRDSTNGINSGSAYVFVNNGGTWEQEDKFLPADVAAGEFFGRFVDLDEDRVVVSCHFDSDNGAESGSAYVFEWSGSSWIQRQKVAPANGGGDEWFSYPVRINGDNLVAGAIRTDASGVNSGAAYVFHFDGIDWSQTSRFTPADGAASDLYSFDVFYSNSHFVVGSLADDDEGDASGSVYSYDSSEFAPLEESLFIDDFESYPVGAGTLTYPWFPDDPDRTGVSDSLLVDRGKSGYIGLHPNASTQLVRLDRSIYQVDLDESDQPVVFFDLDFGLRSSTSGGDDLFYISVVGGGGDHLAEFGFYYDSTQSKWVIASNSMHRDDWIAEGTLQNNTIYRLRMRLDLRGNRWSASIGPTVVVDNETLATPDANLNLFDLRFDWLINDLQSPGDNLLAFDNLEMRKSSGNYPFIVSDPSGVVVEPGQTTTLSVIAGGPGPHSFQWHKNDSPLAGEDAPSLTLSNVQLADSAQYHVEVSNDSGALATSQDAAVSVLLPGRNIIDWGRISTESDPPSSVDDWRQIAFVNGNAVDVMAGLDGSGSLHVWGDDFSVKNDAPSLTDVRHFDISGHGLAVLNNGAVVGWGSNNYGQASVPSYLSTAGAGVVMVGTGSVHSVVLLADGTIRSWGRNYRTSGFIGSTTRYTGQAVAPSGRYRAISVGPYHNLAIESSRGWVRAWGDNNSGQTSVPGIINPIAVHAGRDFSMALQADGTVVAWGSNVFGQCDVPAGLTDVVALASGSSYAAALRANGEVVAWGNLQVGIDAIPSGLNNVQMFAGGGYGAAVILGDPLEIVIASDLSDRLVASGQSLHLEVDAFIPVNSGVPYPALRYQWYEGETGDESSPLTALSSSPNYNTGPLMEDTRYWVKIVEYDFDNASIIQSINSSTANVDVELPPSAINLSNRVLSENLPAGTTVGTLTTTDPTPGDTFTYSIVSSADASSFAIGGGAADELVTQFSSDHESKSFYVVRVRSTDAKGLWIESTLTVSVPDDRTEDADGDGLTEAAEEDIHGTSDLLADTDGDKYGDGKETELGTDPNDVNDLPHWWQRKHLFASDGVAGDEFGRSVAIGENHILVGTIYRDFTGSNDVGRAYVFDRRTGQQLHAIDTPDEMAGGRFGWEVAVDGDIGVSSAAWHSANGTAAGAAYILNLRSGSVDETLFPPDSAPDDLFGFDVDIGGGLIAVGSPRNGDNGAVYIFDAASGELVRKIVASDGTSGDWFGNVVKIHDGKLAVAARCDDVNGSDSGSVYMFDITTGSELWKYTPSDGATEEFFGEAMDFDQRHLVVGAHADEVGGSAYVLDTATGEFLRKLTASDAVSGDRFGHSVTLCGNIAVVAALIDDGSRGSVYVFNVVTGVEILKSRGSEVQAVDYFGFNLDSYQGDVVVGTQLDDDLGEQSGSVYVFELVKDHDQGSDAWQLANGFNPGIPNEEGSLDSDGDGDLDLLEIFQGTGRNNSTEAHGIRNIAADGTDLSVTIRKSTSQSAVNAEGLWSTDLTNWHSSGETSDGVTVNLTESVTGTGPGYELITIEASVAGGSVDQLFLKLSLTPNE